MSWVDMTPLEASRTTLREFSFYMESHRLKKEQSNRDIAMQSWLNQSAKATNKKGNKSAYKDFSDFYNKTFNGNKNENKKVSMAERNYRMNKARKEASNGGNR